MRRRSFPRDPYWLTARYRGECRGCGAEILKGSRAFYYPNTRTLLCEHDGCGGEASRDFEAARADERSMAR